MLQPLAAAAPAATTRARLSASRRAVPGTPQQQLQLQQPGGEKVQAKPQQLQQSLRPPSGAALQSQQWQQPLLARTGSGLTRRAAAASTAAALLRQPFSARVRLRYALDQLAHAELSLFTPGVKDAASVGQYPGWEVTCGLSGFGWSWSALVPPFATAPHVTGSVRAYAFTPL